MTRAPITFERYRALRRANQSLNDRIRRTLPLHAYEETAAKLGMFEGGQIQMFTVYDLAALIDCAIHELAPLDGTSAVTRFAASPPADLTDDERMLLAGLVDTHVSALRVTKARPEIGAELVDILTGETFLQVDESLAATATPGAMLFGRSIRLPGFTISAGVPLRPPQLALEALARLPLLPAEARTRETFSLISKHIVRLARAIDDDDAEGLIVLLATTSRDPVSQALRRILTELQRVDAPMHPRFAAERRRGPPTPR